MRHHDQGSDTSLTINHQPNKTMSRQTFNTADEVFHDAEVEYGNALGSLILASAGLSGTPPNRARNDVAIKARALGEAARFAANHPNPQAP
jgi:hypothetical protein